MLTRRSRVILLDVFKSINMLNSDCLNDMFKIKDGNYSSRKAKRKTTTFGLRNIAYLGVKLCNDIFFTLKHFYNEYFVLWYSIDVVATLSYYKGIWSIKLQPFGNGDQHRISLNIAMVVKLLVGTCLLERASLGTYDVSIIRYMCIDINWVSGPKLGSSGEKPSPIPHVPVLIPRPVCNKRDRMCQRYGSDLTQIFQVLVQNQLYNKFMNYYIFHWRIFGIGLFILSNYVFDARETNGTVI